MNKSVPAATVLMPVYNGMPYLPEAIESVLEQSFSDYELLIIDDGSDDDSLSVISSYADPRIRVISRPNKGLIDTLNEGVAAAASSLIIRFDADDICLPRRLMTQITFMQAHPDCVISGSDIAYIDKDGTYLMDYRMPGHTDAEIRQGNVHICPFVHSAVIYRKAAVIAAGGYAPGALTFEDHLLWIKLLSLGRGHNHNEILIKVRFNPASVTVDEKWRGARFSLIKHRSIKAGFVTDEDAAELCLILKSQRNKLFKDAAYYGMLGKKYIWNKPDPVRARQNLRLAITALPKKPEPYMLYLLTFIPAIMVRWLYQKIKRTA